jgi:hypothetical protein
LSALRAIRFVSAGRKTLLAARVLILVLIRSTLGSWVAFCRRRSRRREAVYPPPLIIEPSDGKDEPDSADFFRAKPQFSTDQLAWRAYNLVAALGSIFPDSYGAKAGSTSVITR